MPNEGPAPYPYHAAAPPMYVPQYYQHPPGINPLMPMNVPLYSSMGAQVPLPQQVPAAYPYYPTAAPIPGAISPPDYGAQIGVHGEQRQPVVAWENSTVPNVNNANLYPAPIPVASSIPHDVSSPQIVMTMPQEGTTVSQVAISPAGAQDPAAEEQKPKEKKKFLYIAPPPPDFKPPCLLYILTWPFILVFVVVRSVLESTYRAVVGISKFTWNSILIPIAKAVLYIINIPYKYILRPLGKAIASCSKVICPCIPCGSCFAAIGQFFVGIGGFFVEIGKIFWFAIKSLVSSLGYVIWSLATMIVLIVYHVLEAFWEVFFESCHCILKPVSIRRIVFLVIYPIPYVKLSLHTDRPCMQSVF